MKISVADMPIYHHYLASILLKVGLVEGTYAQIMEQIGNYTVTGRCKCGDKTCNTVHLKTESPIKTDDTYCFGFNIGYIIFNFYDDGALEVESLADSEKHNFPFRQELELAFAGEKIKYDDASYAANIVQKFMQELKRSDVTRIEV